MRISGGTAKGRRVVLRASLSKRQEADALRPTSAKVRKAIFDILGPRIIGCRFLDLYAGTGAVGLEALSRGADFVIFIDDSPARTLAITDLAQVVVPLIDGDLALILAAAAEGRLDPASVKLHDASAVTVVMASRGYPDAYESGKEIKGLDTVSAERGEVVFHAGTRRDGSRIVSSGGRVLSVTAVGYSHELESTIADAYRIVHRIAFDGAYYRSDIGKKALKGVTSSQVNRSTQGGQ